MPITNTLEVSRRLTQAGVPAAQADVFSELFEGTAQDAVREMRAIVGQEGERIRAELRSELSGVEDRLRAEFRGELTGVEGRLRGELTGVEGRLRGELHKELRQQMLWFFMMLVGVSGAALALARLLFHA